MPTGREADRKAASLPEKTAHPRPRDRGPGLSACLSCPFAPAARRPRGAVRVPPPHSWGHGRHEAPHSPSAKLLHSPRCPGAVTRGRKGRWARAESRRARAKEVAWGHGRAQLRNAARLRPCPGHAPRSLGQSDRKAQPPSAARLLPCPGHAPRLTSANLTAKPNSHVAFVWASRVA